MFVCVCPQENVSLADILSLRDSCLSEEEVWAVCAECAQALQSIRPSHLFHTLCITPDTLAFNAHGNVCFMEQLSGESVAQIHCYLYIYHIITGSKPLSKHCIHLELFLTTFLYLTLFNDSYCLCDFAFYCVL